MRDALGGIQSLLVLGGTSDIALATARALVRGRTRRVFLAGRDQDALNRSAEALRSEGADAVEVLEFDATRLDDHPALVERAFADAGDIDAVLLAFGALGGPDPRDRDGALGCATTNFVGAVSIALPIAERFEAQGHGTLIVLSSLAGQRVRKSNFGYGASKAGLDGFSQGLADALHGTGVDVMVVRPGFVRTKMTAGMKEPPFTTSPERVADSILTGLARGSREVWAPSIMRWVMLALKLLPRPLFRRLPF
jgi:decaprenylphospho-beta-D-erythro-pentofuranosid-2-ulose 2-reductase